jgi:hypothetical protein
VHVRVLLLALLLWQAHIRQHEVQLPPPFLRIRFQLGRHIRGVSYGVIERPVPHEHEPRLVLCLDPVVVADADPGAVFQDDVGGVSDCVIRRSNVDLRGVVKLLFEKADELLVFLRKVQSVSESLRGRRGSNS